MNMTTQKAIEALDAIEQCLNPAMALFARDVKRYIQAASLAEATKKEKAEAVMVFAKSIVYAGESGFVSPTGWTVCDIYQCARDHVRAQYKAETKPLAVECCEADE